MSDDVISLQQRVAALEKRVRFLLVCCGLLLALVILLPAINPVKAAAGQLDSLTVKRLAVVDEKGTERVIIAAPLPDPMVHGKRVKRAGPISGILIQDPSGSERGGYATSEGNDRGAFLTLDSENDQVFTVYANPDSGATLSLNNEKKDGLVFTTYKQPVMNIRKEGKVIYKQPPDAPDLH
jgi:hypothetical protein